MVVVVVVEGVEVGLDFDWFDVELVLQNDGFWLVVFIVYIDDFCEVMDCFCVIFVKDECSF